MDENQNNSSLHEEKNLISQRYLEDSDEEILRPEIDGVILSSVIENQIEFCIPITAEDNHNHRKIKDKIKLFADCDEFVDIDKKIKTTPQKKPIITKRIIEPEINPMSEADKIKSVVIDSLFILEKTETKYWTDRKKSKIMKYKSKTGNPYQFVEPENEFSKIRKKNCWSEKRISRTFQK